MSTSRRGSRRGICCAEVDVRGQKRPNATHASTTDPDARRFRTSQGTGALP